MKYLLTAILCILVFATVAAAQANVAFAWDYGTPMPSGFEFRLTSTATPPAPLVTFDCGPAPTKTCTVTGIPAGDWTAQVFAYKVGVPDTLKTYSDGSNTVPLTIPAKPAAPTGLRPGTASMALNITWPANSSVVINAEVVKKK